MQSCKHYGNLLCLWCPNIRFHDVSHAFTEFFATCEWRFPQTNEPASSCHFGEARSRPESAAWNPRSTVGRVLAVDGNGGPNIIMGDFPWFFIRIPMVAHDAMVLVWSQSLRTWDLQASAPSTTEARDGGCSWGTREVDQPDSPCCGAFSTWYECKSLGFRTCIAWRWMEIPYIYNLTTSTQNYGFLQCTYVIYVCSNMLCIRFFQHDSNRHKTFGLKHQGQRMATLDRPYPRRMRHAFRCAHRVRGLPCCGKVHARCWSKTRGVTQNKYIEGSSSCRPKSPPQAVSQT